jgi:hypothetical protein
LDAIGTCQTESSADCSWPKTVDAPTSSTATPATVAHTPVDGRSSRASISSIALAPFSPIRSES